MQREADNSHPPNTEIENNFRSNTLLLSRSCNDLVVKDTVVVSYLFVFIHHPVTSVTTLSLTNAIID
jgi:hypothetical protein